MRIKAATAGIGAYFALGMLARIRTMAWERIRKRLEDYADTNLQNYNDCAKTFSWAQARGLLDGLPDGGLNIAHEAIDRHIAAGRGDKFAMRWIGRDDRVRDFTYASGLCRARETTSNGETSGSCVVAGSSCFSRTSWISRL